VAAVVAQVVQVHRLEVMVVLVVAVVLEEAHGLVEQEIPQRQHHPLTHMPFRGILVAMALPQEAVEAVAVQVDLERHHKQYLDMQVMAAQLKYLQFLVLQHIMLEAAGVHFIRQQMVVVLVAALQPHHKKAAVEMEMGRAHHKHQLLAR
jgi:hypothetical protein